MSREPTSGVSGESSWKRGESSWKRLWLKFFFRRNYFRRLTASLGDHNLRRGSDNVVIKVSMPSKLAMRLILNEKVKNNSGWKKVKWKRWKQLFDTRTSVEGRWTVTLRSSLLTRAFASQKTYRLSCLDLHFFLTLSTIFVCELWTKFGSFFIFAYLSSIKLWRCDPLSWPERSIHKKHTGWFLTDVEFVKCFYTRARFPFFLLLNFTWIKTRKSRHFWQIIDNLFLTCIYFTKKK